MGGCGPGGDVTALHGRRPGPIAGTPESQNTQQTQQNQTQNRDKHNPRPLPTTLSLQEFPRRRRSGNRQCPVRRSNPILRRRRPRLIRRFRSSRPLQPARRPRLSGPAPPLPPDPPLSTDPVERQLQNDTAQLLQLVRELKAEVDKAGNNTLSLAALQKADEMQKLAQSLKERMRDRGQIIVSKP